MRIEKYRKIINYKGLDGLYITDKYNMRYITGFTGTTGYALVLKGRNIFFTDFRYIEQANLEVVKNGFEVINVGKKYSETLGNILKDENVKILGIEDKNLTLESYRKLVSDFDFVSFTEIGDALMKARMVKSEEELAIIRKAAEIADRAFAEILPEIKEGVTEHEIAAKLEYIMKREGAEERSFETIIASGWRSAMPHGVASRKTIGKNEFVKLDFGCYFNGYVSDMTRTVFYGDNITDKHREIYNTVLEAQLLGVSKAKAGMKCSELDGIVRDFITSKGYGDKFGHGLGHGIGLEIHEEPSVSPRGGDTVLEENMVVTIEPGIYIEGFGGVRIEDDIIIKSDGCEIINKTPKELITIK